MQHPHSKEPSGTVNRHTKLISILRSKKWGCESGAPATKPTLSQLSANSQPTLNQPSANAWLGQHRDSPRFATPLRLPKWDVVASQCTRYTPRPSAGVGLGG